MTDQSLPLRIAVVGAGAAGFFAAAAIKRNCPNTEVTIIYDPATPYIGVGESLGWQGPSFFAKYLGLTDEFSWLKKSGSTYKYSVALKDWHGESDEKYYMTFPFNPSYKVLDKSVWYNGNSQEYQIHNNEYNLYTVLLHLRAKGLVDDYIFQQYVSEYWWHAHYNTCHIGVDPTQRTRSTMGYSYHINADHVRHVIHDMVGKPAGVKELPLKVKQIVHKENGDIDYLTLEDDSKFYADLFIDSSGFKRVLVNSLPYEWEPCDEYFNNSALVGQHKFKDYSEYNSETLTQAMKYGWRFSIPADGRSGEGYQFNDRIFGDEQAIVDNYIQRTGNTDVNFRRLKWEPGYYKKSMVKNCIAIGISHGFMDVFDANNFSASIRHIGRLVDHIRADPSRTLDWRDSYNELVGSMNYFIKLRIQVAFHLARRNDTVYWQEMKEAERKFRTRERLIDTSLDPHMRSYNNGRTANNRTYANHTFINQALYNRESIPKEQCIINISDFEEKQALIFFKYFADTYKLRAENSTSFADFYRILYPTLDTKENTRVPDQHMDFLG